MSFLPKFIFFWIETSPYQLVVEFYSETKWFDFFAEKAKMMIFYQIIYF